MAAVLLGVIICDTWLAPYYPLFFVMAAGIAVATGWELTDLLIAYPMPIRRWFCVIGGALIPISVWFTAWGSEGYVAFVGSSNPNFRAPAAFFCGLAMVAFMIEALNYRAPGRAMPAIAGHLIVFFYVGILGSFVVSLRWFGSTPAEGTYMLVASVFTAKFGDIGAFFVGRRFGRNKMAPLLSPGKTIEGAVGALASATLFGLLLALVGKAVGFFPGLPWYAGAIFGLVVGWAALVGDLMESLMKRDCRTKDASDSIPGFGGVLDVVDSVFFSAPVAYLLFSLWKAIERTGSVAIGPG